MKGTNPITQGHRWQKRVKERLKKHEHEEGQWERLEDKKSEEIRARHAAEESAAAAEAEIDPGAEAIFAAADAGTDLRDEIFGSSRGSSPTWSSSELPAASPHVRAEQHAFGASNASASSAATRQSCHPTATSGSGGTGLRDQVLGSMQPPAPPPPPQPTATAAASNCKTPFDAPSARPSAPGGPFDDLGWSSRAPSSTPFDAPTSGGPEVSSASLTAAAALFSTVGPATTPSTAQGKERSAADNAADLFRTAPRPVPDLSDLFPGSGHHR